MYDHEKIPTKQRILLISQGIFHFLLAVFVTSTVWLMAYNGNWHSMHTWHVFLSTIGIAFLMAEAIALLNPGNAFVLGCAKLSRGFLHGVLMMFAVIASVSIKTIYGITGFTAYLLIIFSFLGGLLTAFAKFLYKLLNIKPIFLKSCHIFFAIGAFVLGTITLCYGLRNYFTEASYATNSGFITILAMCTILNVLGPLRTLFRI